MYGMIMNVMEIIKEYLLKMIVKMHFIEMKILDISLFHKRILITPRLRVISVF